MKTEFKEGKLVIDLWDVLDSIKFEERAEILEFIACDPAVIKHVADQIIDRWTENGSSGGSQYPATANPAAWNALDVAWRRVAKASGDVAKREIERLEKALALSEKNLQELRDEVYNKPTKY